MLATALYPVMAPAANWYAGWALILCGFLSGATLGLFFHRESFLGGYGSFARRLVRLGHIALVALGALNILFWLAAQASVHPNATQTASVAWMAGGVGMPLVCFLSAWRPSLRPLFVIPVLSLVTAVAAVLLGGYP